MKKEKEIIEKQHYFEGERANVIRDWLKDDVEEFKVETKKKEWKFKYSGVIWLYILVAACVIWGILSIK